jgi:N-acetyl-anhydromuramyl-L-alanine amidase AmpD
LGSLVLRQAFVLQNFITALAAINAAAQAKAFEFDMGLPKVSAHYIIDPDGHVV